MEIVFFFVDESTSDHLAWKLIVSDAYLHACYTSRFVSKFDLKYARAISWVCSVTSPLKTWKYFVKGNDVNFWSISIKTTKTSEGLCPCKWSDYIWNLIERRSHCWMFFRTKLLKIFLKLLFTISVWPFVCGR